MTHRWGWKGIVVLSVMLMGLAAGVFKGYARTPRASRNVPEQGECVSLDMAVLVDQSSSMRDNDSKNLRFDVVKSIIEYLADLTLHFCPGAKHRLLVAGFGDRSSNWREDVRIYINTEISPQDIEAWSQLRREIYPKLPQGDDEEYLGSTDFLSALRLVAEEIFPQWEQQPLDDPYPRRRALFFITDGGPCVYDEGCRRDDISQFNIKKAMERIRNYIYNHFMWRGENSASSVFIIGIALNDKKHDYWPLVGDVWTEIAQAYGGKFWAIDPTLSNEAYLVRYTYEALSAVAPFPFVMANCGLNSLDIPIVPYRGRAVTFHIWRLSQSDKRAHAELVLQTANQEFRLYGGRAEPQVPTCFADYSAPTAYSERYTFQPVCPGIYSIRTPESSQCNVEVYYTQGPEANVDVAVTGKIQYQGGVLPVVEEPPHYYKELKPHFTFRLYRTTPEGQEEPIQEENGYPIRICVLVQRPDGGLDWYGNFRPVQPGEYANQNEPIRTPVEGLYEWRLFAFTRTPASVVKGEIPPNYPVDQFCPQLVQELNCLSDEDAQLRDRLPADQGASALSQYWTSIFVRWTADNQEQCRGFQGSFHAQRIPLFTLKWLEPKPEEEYLLLARQLVDGQVEPQKLALHLRAIQGDTGPPLDLDALFENPEESVTAFLYPQGQPQHKLDIPLTRDPGAPSDYVARIELPTDWGEDTYVLQLQINGQIQGTYLPMKRNLQREFEGYIRRQLMPSLQVDLKTVYASPLTSLSDFLRTLKGQPAPIPFRLQFLHQDQAVPLDGIFAEEPPTLPLKVIAPDGTEATVTLEPQDEFRYFGIWAEPPGLPGTYQVHLSLEDIQPTRYFEWVEPRYEDQFTLQIAGLASPTATRGLALAAGVFALLLGWLVYTLCFTGPTGTLEVLRNGSLVEAFSLHRFRCFGRNRFEIELEEKRVQFRVRREGPAIAVEYRTQYEEGGWSDWVAVSTLEPDDEDLPPEFDINLRYLTDKI